MTRSSASPAVERNELRLPLWRAHVPLSDNQVHYFTSDAVGFPVFSVIPRWYFWPAFKDPAPKMALSSLLLYACLRMNYSKGAGT